MLDGVRQGSSCLQHLQHHQVALLHGQRSVFGHGCSHQQHISTHTFQLNCCKLEFSAPKVHRISASDRLTIHVVHLHVYILSPPEVPATRSLPELPMISRMTSSALSHALQALSFQGRLMLPMTSDRLHSHLTTSSMFSKLLLYSRVL